MKLLKRGVIVFTLLLSVIASSFILNPNVFAASSSAPSVQYHFLHYNKKGHLVQSWSGLQSDKTKVQHDLQQLSAIEIAESKNAPSTKTSQHLLNPSIQLEGNCPSNAGYLSIETSGGDWYCFAYTGTMGVNLISVVLIETGNNEVNFVYQAQGAVGYTHVPGDGKQICKGDTFSGSFYDVLQVSITDPSDPCENF